jgi:hypothetical protein
VKGWLYHFTNPPIVEFRATGLDEAARIEREISEAIRAVLGDRAEGYVSIGNVSAHPSNFAPRKP